MPEAMYVLIGLHIDGLRDLFAAVEGNSGDLRCRDRVFVKRVLAEMWPASIGGLVVLIRALCGKEMDSVTASVWLASLIAPPGGTLHRDQAGLASRRSSRVPGRSTEPWRGCRQAEPIAATIRSVLELACERE